MKSAVVAKEKFDEKELAAAVANNNKPIEVIRSDRWFDRFQARIAIAPSQLLRYYHHHYEDENVGESTGLQPLWINDQRCDEELLICDRCQEKRVAEVQVLFLIL